MSFEIFVQSFQNGQAVNLPDELVRTSFLDHCVDKSWDVCVLEYPDGSSQRVANA